MRPIPIPVLLIGGDPADADAVREALADDEDGSFIVERAPRPVDGLDRLRSRAFAAVLLDLNGSEAQGLADVEQVLQAAPHIPILIIGSVDNRDIGREAVKRGAQDYLEQNQCDGHSLPRAVRHAIQRHAAEEALFFEHQRAEVTLNSIGDAVLSIDLLGRVTYLNPVAERMTGWARQDALGRPFDAVCHLLDGDTREPARNPLVMAMRLQKTVCLTPHCLLVRKDGSETAIEDSASPIHDRGGQAIGAVMVFHDVSEARALALRATHMAQHDFLTDLPNRMLLQDRMTQSMALARRRGHRTAVLFVDLDRFKHVNDTWGHPVGDALLHSVAQRLAACVRRSDTVSRLGGDEFVVLLSEIHDVGDAAATAQKIIAALVAPHDIMHHHLHVTASVGIALYPEDGRTAETLISNADAAMYRAKDAGPNSYQLCERGLKGNHLSNDIACEGTNAFF